MSRLYPERDAPDEVDEEFWLIVANNYLTDERYNLEQQALMLEAEARDFLGEAY